MHLVASGGEGGSPVTVQTSFDWPGCTAFLALVAGLERLLVPLCL